MLLHFDSLSEVLDFISSFTPSAEAADQSSSDDESGDPMIAASQVAFIIARLNATHNSCINRPGKITAIKLYRTIMGCSLKEAKEAIERTPYFSA